MSASDRAFLGFSSSYSSASYTTDEKHTAQSVREHIDDVDAAKPPQQDVLTQPWSANDRSSRPPALPSALDSVERGPSNFAILPIPNNFTHNTRQDVRRNPLNVGSSRLLSTSSLYRHVQPSGSNLPSSSAHSQNASLNTLNNRLRTNLPVFGTTSELAAHYGIPRKFPQPPRITSNNTRPPVPRFSETNSPSQPSPSSADPLQSLMSGYLDMLKSNPDESTASIPTLSPAVGMDDSFPGTDEAAQHLAALLGTYSTYRSVSGGMTHLTYPDTLATPDMWNEYLTSPFDESPLDFPLETPAQGSADLNDFFTSPAVADFNSFDNYGDFPLFPQESYAENSLDLSKMSVTTQSQVTHVSSAFDGLLTMSPALDTSPQIDDSPNPLEETRHKSRNPTGTRKNVTPDSLIPLDAPTQPRSYLTPSTTSRKELPAVFARKRARSTAFGDEEDELVDDGEARPTLTEAEAIEAKRRQNTLAARRSRKRKLEYQKQLEEKAEAMRLEMELWKGRAIMLQTQLAAQGINVPFPDP